MLNELSSSNQLLDTASPGYDEYGDDYAVYSFERSLGTQSSEAAFIQKLSQANPGILGDYFRSLFPVKFSQTSASHVFQTVPIQMIRETATTEIHENLTALESVEPKRYISIGEALTLQDEIHRRLKQEIEEGPSIADPFVIEDSRLAKQIQQIAEREQRSIEQVLFSMVTQYQPQSVAGETPNAEEMARYVRLDAYKRARDYWGRSGNTERAQMTDSQLDEAFWLFDADGIPRLKAEMNEVELPESSLHRAGQVLRSAGFHSGQTDIGARSREILNDEFTDYLLSRMNLSDDANNSPSS